MACEISMVFFNKENREVINNYELKNYPGKYYGISYDIFRIIYLDILGKQKNNHRQNFDKIWIFDIYIDGYGFFGNTCNPQQLHISEYEKIWNEKYPLCTCQLKGCDNIYRKKVQNQMFCSFECRQKAMRENKNVGRYTIFERDNFTCFYCGKTSYKDNIELHCDHIHPKSLGGEDVAGNLVTACIDCNLEKHNAIINDCDSILKEVEKRNKERNIGNNVTIKL